MDPSGACVEPLSFVLCVTAAGTVIGVTTGVAYNVFVVQEKGGIENLPEMLNLSYYCDVDWKLALFSGGLGGLIGALTAATSGHAAEVLYRHAAEDALAREYGFKGRDELIRRAREKGLSLREYLLGWDTDIGGFKPEELEYARRIQQERGIELVRKRLSDAGNYDWVGSDGEFYDAMGIPEGGRSRPIDEQSNQFIKSLNEHLRNKQGPHGEPAYIPIFLEDVDQNAIDVIKRYIESLPESEQRRIIPWGFQ